MQRPRRKFAEIGTTSVRYLFRRAHVCTYVWEEERTLVELVYTCVQRLLLLLVCKMRHVAALWAPLFESRDSVGSGTRVRIR